MGLTAPTFEPLEDLREYIEETGKGFPKEDAYSVEGDLSHVSWEMGKEVGDRARGAGAYR